MDIRTAWQIEKKILGLEEFPEKYRVYDKELWCIRRRTNKKYIFYLVRTGNHHARKCGDFSFYTQNPFSEIFAFYATENA